MLRTLIACVALSGAVQAGAADLAGQVDALSRRQLASVIEFLADDLLEGRAPGTRGGELAELYSRTQMEWMGLEPGWQGSYLQPFVMKGFTTTDLAVSAGGVRLAYLEDVVGNYLRDRERFSLSADAVFVGFGISEPEWQWDDYGDADVRGKLVIARVNDPGSVDPSLFQGREMTYFGRWRYKIERAAAAGARAILLVHTDASAGYGWQVVRNSWSGESLHLPASLANGLEFAGWISEAGLRRLLATRGVDLDGLYAKSARPSFRPVPLGLEVELSGANAFREVRAANVVGEIPGRSGKRIVLVAHIDHLGVNPTLDGDQILNGAIDNGSAVAALLLGARILAAHRGELEHTVTVLACQAEEEGLLGSTYYASTVDPRSIAAAICFESTPVWGPSRSVMGVGAKYSTLEDLLRAVAAQSGLGVSEFSMSEQGFFFRSDQFSFAQRGIPSLWISAGEDFASGRNHLMEFFKGPYHTAADEFDPAWVLESLRQTIRTAVLLVAAIDAAPEPPRWKRRLPFPVER